MKFAFAGTPDFAARVLVHLDAIGRRPCFVVSQPDRPKGRGKKLSPPEVVPVAEKLSLPYLQVEDINHPGTIARIAASGATHLVVAAFGQILQPAVLRGFPCLNVHASLLPAYRGAAPIERAIAAGETETGVSIMRMTEGLDEGPWAVQTRLSIGPRDDAGSVARALAVLGAEGIDQVLTGLEDGNIQWVEQEGPGSYAAKLTAADTVLDFTKSALQVHDQVRSLSPDIGSKVSTESLDLKVWRSWPYSVPGCFSVPEPVRPACGSPGTLAQAGKRLFLGCGEGAVEILQIQPAGKGKMPTADFLRGYADRLGGSLLPPAAGPAPRDPAPPTIEEE